MAYSIRSAAELEKMHRAGQVVYEVLNELRAHVKPGMTTMDLEKFAEQRIAGRAPARRRLRVIAVIPVCCALR